MGDRYGRKWPLIIDLLCCGALSLGTAFTKDFSSFLAVRALFGIVMGGIWYVLYLSLRRGQCRLQATPRVHQRDNFLTSDRFSLCRGLSAAAGLESLPMEARGLFSGILQQGYAGKSISALTLSSSSKFSLDKHTAFY